MHRSKSVLAMALAVAVFVLFAPASSLAAHHEPVIQVVSVDVKPGKLDTYRSRVRQLVGVMKRLGSKGQVRMWRLTVGGPETGGVIVGIEYPTSAEWAADTAKLQADSEYTKIIARLDDIRTINSNAVWRDISVTRMPDAEVDGTPVHVLAHEPADDPEFEYVLSYVTQDHCVPLKTEFFESGRRLRKVLLADPAAVTAAEGLWIPRKMVMKDLTQGTSTEFNVDSIDVNAKIHRRIFTQSSLSQGN